MENNGNGRKSLWVAWLTKIECPVLWIFLLRFLEQEQNEFGF